jgi:hypothetical protein
MCISHIGRQSRFRVRADYHRKKWKASGKAGLRENRDVQTEDYERKGNASSKAQKYRMIDNSPCQIDVIRQKRRGPAFVKPAPVTRTNASATEGQRFERELLSLISLRNEIQQG